MYIFFATRTDGSDYDQFGDMVIVASNTAEAEHYIRYQVLQTNPSVGLTEEEFLKREEELSRQVKSHYWRNYELILMGTPVESTVKGVIVSEFHAG